MCHHNGLVCRAWWQTGPFSVAYFFGFPSQRLHYITDPPLLPSLTEFHLPARFEAAEERTALTFEMTVGE